VSPAIRPLMADIRRVKSCVLLLYVEVFFQILCV